MIRGILKPNGYPAHIRAGVQILQAGREFVVDPAAKRPIVDEPGKVLVLSPEGYEHFRQAFGKSLICEPIGGSVEGAGGVEMIARLEAEILGAEKRREEAEGRIAAAERQRDQARAEFAQQRQLNTDLVQERDRIEQERARAVARAAELETAVKAHEKAPKR